MSVIVKKGRCKIEWLPVTTSTAFTKDTLVDYSSNLIAAAADNDTDVAGIITKAITSSDSDYATSRLVPVRVPIDKHVVFEMDYTGSPGVGADYGISDKTTVDGSDTSNKLVRVIRVLSGASKVWCYIKFNTGLY